MFFQRFQATWVICSCCCCCYYCFCNSCCCCLCLWLVLLKYISMFALADCNAICMHCAWQTKRRTHATTPGRASQSPAAAAAVATAEAIVELRSALWKMLRQLQQQAKGSSSSNSNDNNDNSNSNCPEIMLSKTENSKVIASCTHSHTHTNIATHTYKQINNKLFPEWKLVLTLFFVPPCGTRCCILMMAINREELKRSRDSGSPCCHNNCYV